MDFSLKNQDEILINLSDFRGKKCVVFFYPRALTPGCTRQNCELSALSDEFAAANIVLIGISPDSPDKLRLFKDRYQLTHLLLSDPTHEVAELFGAWGMKKHYGREYVGLIRSAFVLNERGEIIKEYRKHKSTGFAALLKYDLLSR